MNWKQICGWFVLAAVISCSAAASLGETYTATIGEPYILKTGYKGSRDGVWYHCIKDGKPYVPDHIRVFLLLRRLSFVEITESDAGTYQIEIQGKGGLHYTKTIKLLGMYYIAVVSSCGYVICAYMQCIHILCSNATVTYEHCFMCVGCISMHQLLVCLHVCMIYIRRRMRN